MRVVVANEPRSYRESISAAFEALRPQVQVSTVDPEDLDQEVERLAPQLVVCSRLTSAVEHDAPIWVLLYPNGASHAVVYQNGVRTHHPVMDLDTLLSVLDEAQRLDGSV